MSYYNNPAGPQQYVPANSPVNAQPNFNYGGISTAGYNTDMQTQSQSSSGGLLKGIGSALLGGIGGIAGGAMNLIGGLLNQRAQRKENEKARQYQTAEREAQNQWNLDMWNKQNEYNTPQAQMQRMLEAGINPAAAAQGISGSNQSAGSVQGASNGGAPNNSLPDNGLGRLGDAIGNSVNSALNAQTLAQGIQKQAVEIRKQEIENEIVGEELAIRKNERYESDATLNDKIKSVQNMADKAVADKQISQETAEIVRLTAPFVIGKSAEELNKLREEVRIAEGQVRQIDENIKNTIEQRKAIAQQIKTLRAQEANYNASTGLMQEQALTEEKQQELLALQAQEKELTNQLQALEVERKQIMTDNIKNLGIDPSLPSYEKMVQSWSKVGESSDDNINVLSSLGYSLDWLLDRAGGIIGAGLVGKGASKAGNAGRTTTATKHEPPVKYDYASGTFYDNPKYTTSGTR